MCMHAMTVWGYDQCDMITTNKKAVSGSLCSSSNGPVAAKFGKGIPTRRASTSWQGICRMAAPHLFVADGCAQEGGCGQRQVGALVGCQRQALGQQQGEVGHCLQVGIVLAGSVQELEQSRAGRQGWQRLMYYLQLDTGTAGVSYSTTTGSLYMDMT